MEFDPDNPVVQLCVKGMNAEGEGKIEEAHTLFRQAWDTASSNFEKFTAAHYLARNQKDPADVLKWNLEALACADMIKQEGIKGHYPSLYLNVAKSYQRLGARQEAVRYYLLASGSCQHLPSGSYADMIRSGISQGLNGVQGGPALDERITQLINCWCQDKELRPLAVILPAYVGYLGSDDDINKVLSAFSYLSAMRCLDNDQQGMVEQIIAGLRRQQPE